MNLTKMESYLRVNLLGLGPRLVKKNLPGRGLTKVEKHRFNLHFIFSFSDKELEVKEKQYYQ